MTLPVEDDFREFVAARWPDLDGVALVVTLDPAAATRLTTDALATLHRHWGEALEDGLPGEQARRAVLRAAVAAAARSDARAPDPLPSPDAVDVAFAPQGQRPSDPVPEAPGNGSPISDHRSDRAGCSSTPPHRRTTPTA